MNEGLNPQTAATAPSSTQPCVFRTGRRDFLRSALGLGGAWMCAPSAVARAVESERTAPSNRITLGFIGVGWKGFAGCWGSLLQSFIQEPGTQVLAVCDVDRRYRDRAKSHVDSFYNNSDCAAYVDFRELLSRKDIDAVVIATPDHWHAVMTIMACRESKDVYCEKPLSLTVREARAMVRESRRFVRVVQTGSQSRSNPNLRAACEAIRGGRLGRVREVHVGCGGPSVPCNLPPEPVPDFLEWDLWLGPAPWRPYHSQIHPVAFRAWKDYSGGGMTDWGAHHFDLTQWALGMDATGPVEIIPPDGKEVRSLTYRYADGTSVFHSSMNIDDGVTFVGTEGKATLSGISGRTRFDPVSLAPGAHELVVSDDLRGNRGHYADFLNCVRTRGKPVADVEIGCRSVTVCHLGNIAYALGRHLKWDPNGECFVNDAEADRMLERACREPWGI
jgi:predicted dehydrogenase